MMFNIKEMFGVRCITSQNGQRLFELITPYLEKNQVIELDFSGVEMFSSPFFNYSIGQVFGKNESSDLVGLIKFVGLNEVGEIIVGKVIQNSITYRKDVDISKIISNNLDK